MKDTISPEEKLLRLIRGPKKQSGQAHAVKPASKTNFSQILAKFTHSLDSRKILIGGLAASLIYLIIAVLYPLVGLKISVSRPAKHMAAEPASGQKAEIKPFEYYQEGLSGRKIFGTIETQESTGPISAAGVDIAKDIGLVGIIMGENPQAIIEDKKAAKTYYVTKGQFVQDMQIDEIQEGKIIINYKGQRYELYL